MAVIAVRKPIVRKPKEGKVVEFKTISVPVRISSLADAQALVKTLRAGEEDAIADYIEDKIKKYL